MDIIWSYLFFLQYIRYNLHLFKYILCTYTFSCTSCKVISSHGYWSITVLSNLFFCQKKYTVGWGVCISMQQALIHVKQQDSITRNCQILVLEHILFHTFLIDKKLSPIYTLCRCVFLMNVSLWVPLHQDVLYEKL